MTDLEYVITSSRRLGDKTKTTYLAYIRRFLAYANEHEGGQISPFAVERWRDYLESQDLSDSAVNLAISSVRAASKRLAAHYRDPRYDFAGSVELVPERETPRERHALTVDQARRLLETCDDSPHGIRDHAIITLGLRTGLRASSICALSWEMYHEREGPWLVQVPIKGGRSVSFPLDEVTTAALERWREWLGQHTQVNVSRVFRGMTQHEQTLTINPAMSRSGFRKMMARRSQLAGISATPHTLRHTFVSWARAAGIPDWRISQMTGHRTTKMLDHYTHDQGGPVGDSLPTI